MQLCSQGTVAAETGAPVLAGLLAQLLVGEPHQRPFEKGVAVIDFNQCRQVRQDARTVIGGQRFENRQGQINERQTQA